METKSLEYIIAIAEEKSISRAADRLFVAQSTLSQFLKNYESDLGIALFIRTPSGIRPTDAGRLYINHAYKILCAYRQVTNEMCDIQEMKRGKILFGLSTFRGTYLIPKLLSKFSKLYPNVEVLITEQNSLALEEMIVAGKLDLALVALPLKTADTAVDFFMKDEVLIIAQKNHPVMNFVHYDKKRKKRWVSIKDAAQFDFLLSNHKTILGNVAEQQFINCGVPPKACNTNLSAQLAISMARQGLGLAFTFRSCIDMFNDVEYLSIGPDSVYLDLGLTYPSRNYQSKATKVLSQIILSSNESN